MVQFSGMGRNGPFAAHPPANTTFLVGNLIGDFRVEIEAEATVSRGPGKR